MAAQRRLRPRGSFRAVCAAQRQQKPWDSALPAARRHPTDISQRRDVPSSCGDPAAAAARARQRKTNPSRAAAPADAADAAKMLAADEQAAAAHGLPRIDATNAAQNDFDHLRRLRQAYRVRRPHEMRGLRNEILQ